MLVHVPDLADVVADLHGALRPGGWLVTNFDVRPRRWRMPCTSTKMTSIFGRSYTVRASCRPAASGSTAYRRVDPSGAAQRLRILLDQLVLTSRPRRLIHRQSQRLAAALRQKAG